MSQALWVIRLTQVLRKLVLPHESNTQGGSMGSVLVRPRSHQLRCHASLAPPHGGEIDGQCRETRRDSLYSSCPFAIWPRRRNVLGNLPSPHSLNEAKSLNHGPSGT